MDNYESDRLHNSVRRLNDEDLRALYSALQFRVPRLLNLRFDHIPDSRDEPRSERIFRYCKEYGFLKELETAIRATQAMATARSLNRRRSSFSNRRTSSFRMSADRLIAIGGVLLTLLAWWFPVPSTSTSGPTTNHTQYVEAGSPSSPLTSPSATIPSPSSIQYPDNQPTTQSPPSGGTSGNLPLASVVLVCTFVLWLVSRHQRLELRISPTHVELGSLRISIGGCSAIIGGIVVVVAFGISYLLFHYAPLNNIVSQEETPTPAPLAIILPGPTPTDNGTGVRPTPTLFPGVCIDCGGGGGFSFASGDIFMSSADEGWAISDIGNFFHYTGGSWKAAGSANGLIGKLFLVSPTEGWAVGYGGTILHYVNNQMNSTWVGVESPTYASLNGLYMISKDEGWAVGDKGIILHYKSGNWRVEVELITRNPGPLDSRDLRGVYMVSADEGWAVGDSIVHYKEGKWSIVEDLKPSKIELSCIYMISANEGWAVGKGIIMHYNKGAWKQVASPTQLYLSSVYMVTANEGWAVGGTILHYINGEWTDIGLPIGVSELKSVYMVSATEGWAVGDSNGNYILLHYQNGIWSKYQ